MGLFDLKCKVYLDQLNKNKSSYNMTIIKIFDIIFLM